MVQARRMAPPPSPRVKRSPFQWSTAVLGLLVVAAAVTVYWREGQERFLAILLADTWLFLDFAPKMLAGCLIGAFVTLLLPREVVGRLVGAESGFLGLLLASVVGAFLPGGPVTIFPLAAAFLTLGAEAGTAIAFITSWTLLGYNRALVWELPFFGEDFVIWRIAVAIPLPIIAGLLARLVVRTINARRGGVPWI